MAQISAPGLTPTVAPTTQGTPNVGIEVPVDAFGGAVGHALEGLGTSIEQSSDRIWQRAVDIQNLNNETNAKEADAKYMMESGKLHAEFINKEGLNAGPQALAKHIQDLQDLRTSIRGDLNPMAAKMYDASSLSFMGRNIFNAAGHSGQQMKVASNNAAQSRIDLAQSNMGNEPTDEVSVQRSTRVIETEVDALGRNNGWSPEQIEATKQKKVSEGVANRVIGLADNHGALAAQSMLNDAIKNKTIDPITANRVQATVDRKIADQGSRSITDKVLAGFRNGDETKTEQEYINQGVEEVKAVKGLTDDQRQSLEDRTRTAISIGFRQQHSVQREQQYTDYQTLTKALDTPNSEGRLPTTIDQIKALDPQIAPALDRLRPTQTEAIGRKLLANAMGKTVVPTPDNQKRVQTLQGMAHDDPAQFLATPLYDENIPKFQRDQLLGVQKTLMKQSQSDPRVARALQMLTYDLRSAGISKEANKEDYYQFIGGLQDQLDQYGKDHPGKLPSMEEVRTIGAQLIQKQATPWVLNPWSKTPTYQMPVPDEEREKLRNDPYWKARNMEPNDAMLDRIYRAQKFKELYGGAAKKPTDLHFPPNTPVSE